MRFFRQDITGDRGASMVEYGLMVALIALMALSAVTLLGERTEETFTTVAAELDGQSSEGANNGAESESDDSSDDQSGNSGDQSGNAGDQNQDDQNHDDQNHDDQNQDDQNQDDQNQDDQGNQNGSDDDSHDQHGEDNGDDSGNNGDDSGNNGDDSGNNGDESGNNGDESGNNGGADDAEDDEEAAGPTPEATGTSSDLYWWDSNSTKGQWKASVSYSNETNRHQYLTLEVTQVDDKGRTTSTNVDFYVGANSTTTYTHWNNDINKHKKKVSGVVEVQVKVISVRTSDQNWQSYSYDVDGKPTTVLPPTLP